MAVLYPINFNSSYTRWATTANGSNNKRAGTAMFYGNCFRQAGWLAVFRNTTGHQIKITKVNAQIGSAQDAGITADFICIPMGSAAPASSFNLNGAAIVGSKTVPVCNTISTTPVSVNVPSDKAVIVNNNDYFVAGCISKSHPWGYFNLALNRSSSDLPTADRCYYAQNATSDSTSWTRVGSDGTPWKKHYLHITVNYENNVVPIKITDKSNTEFWQGSSLTIPIDTDYSDWTAELTNTDDFKITKSKNSVIVSSNGYYTLDKKAKITVRGYNSKDSISIKSLCPKIYSASVDKTILRPTEDAKITATGSANTGGFTYTIESQNYLSINANTGVIHAKSRSDSEAAKVIKVTVVAKNNSKIKKTIKITAAHWTVNDIRLSFSSNRLLADATVEGTYIDGSAILVSNQSTSNDLSFKLTLPDSILSFSNTTKLLERILNSTYSTQCIYSISPIETDTEYSISACISQDSGIKTSYTVCAYPQKTWALIYPKCVNTNGVYDNSQTDSCSYLPALAVTDGDSLNWKVALSNYPLYIQTPINPNFEPGTPKMTIDFSPRSRLDTTTKQSKLSFEYFFENAWHQAESEVDYNIDIGMYYNSGWLYNSIDSTTYRDQVVCPKAEITCSVPCGTESIRAHYLLSCSKDTTTVKFPITLYYKVYAPDSVGTKHLQGKRFDLQESRECIVNTLNAANLVFYEYGYLLNNFDVYEPDAYNLFGTHEDPIYVANGPLNKIVEDTLGIQKDFVNFIGQNSKSQRPFRQPRTKIAVDWSIMANDRVATLADGMPNVFLSNTESNDKTASPYNEIYLMLKTLAEPGETFGLTYTEDNIKYKLNYKDVSDNLTHRLIYMS